MNSSFPKLLSIMLLGLLLCGVAQGQSKKKRKKIDKVIVEARGYMGAPYVYGGLSRRGIDCSGLIYSCYKSIGVSLPRTAKDQSRIGSSKSWDNIRPGDIVYFKFKQKGEKWFHTGMITYAGRNDVRFIHASTSRGVIESSLMDSYYRDNVKKFRRVIK